MIRFISLAALLLLRRSARRLPIRAAFRTLGARRPFRDGGLRRAVANLAHAGPRRASFALAMSFGLAIGYVMGRTLADWLLDPWLVLLLNLPALVVIMLAYIWAGLAEAAAIGAVALNKLPNTVVVISEGARALDPHSTKWRRSTGSELGRASACGAAAAGALHGGGGALRPLARLEDRARRGTAGPAERHRVRAEQAFFSFSTSACSSPMLLAFVAVMLAIEYLPGAAS